MIAADTKPDFPDWLSPMLVKELRQGIRSKAFMAVFFLTQLLMILSVVLNLVATSSSRSEEMPIFLNSLFWILISVPVLLIMPVRGFSTLHAEMKTRTLELVFLTRLSARRIAFGKWLALMAQMILLLCAVLPYVMLRYFLGGIDLLEDVQVTVFLLVAGSVLTALTVAMSPFESRIVRIFAIIGFVLLIAFAPSFLGLWLGKAFATGSGALNTLRVYLCILAFVPAFIALCIEIAASRIAPAAENHSTAKRLIGLYFLLVPIPLGFTGMDMRALFLLATVFIAAVVIDALAEPMSTSLSVYRAFLKKGNLGTALSCIFSPGWASATFYVALLGLIGAPLLYLSGSLGDQAEMLGYLSFYGALIFPAALIRLFLPGTPIFLGLYVGTIFLCETFTLILGVMSNLGDKSILLWLSPLPPSVFMFNLTAMIHADPSGEAFVSVTSVVTIILLLVLALRSAGPLRAVHSEARKALQANVQS